MRMQDKIQLYKEMFSAQLREGDGQKKPMEYLLNLMDRLSAAGWSPDNKQKNKNWYLYQKNILHLFQAFVQS